MQTHFTHCLPLPLDLNPEAHFLHIPAKGAVALLFDANHQPFQLLHCADLRRLMRSRWENLSTDKENLQTNTALPASIIAGPRVAYKAVARYIQWNTLPTELEREIAYLQHAREHFPKDANRFARARRVYWLTADLEKINTTWQLTDKTPKTTQLEQQAILGPYPTQSAAQNTLEHMQDLFELCRYPAELRKAPEGQPCLYKDMGRCPAPCDGTVPMKEHHQTMQRCINATRGLHHETESIWYEAMKQAAADMAFERAKRFKEKLEHLPQFIADQIEPSLSLQQRAYLIIGKGPTPKTRSVFLFHHHQITHLKDLKVSDNRHSMLKLRDQCKALMVHQTDEAMDQDSRTDSGLLYWHSIRATDQDRMLTSWDWDQWSDLLQTRPPYWLILSPEKLTS